VRLRINTPGCNVEAVPPNRQGFRREEKLHHVLAAITRAGPLGASRDRLETWIQTTFHSSGQAMYVYLKDLRIRHWVRVTGGRYLLTEDGAKELVNWIAARDAKAVPEVTVSPVLLASE
jgi:predicted transcriptional regulator